MVTLAQLWLPILLATVLVFIASSLINMLLKFWHTPDYRGLPNEDAVREVLNSAPLTPGVYNLPYCRPEAMNTPEMQEKMRVGPLGSIMLRAPGSFNLGASLGAWFVFCLVISILCATIVALAVPRGLFAREVFHLTAAGAFMAHALGGIPNAIWWSHPWRMTFKYVIDGILYALITGAVFAWFWPG